MTALPKKQKSGPILSALHDMDGVYYSGDSNVNPAASESPETESSVNADVDNEFSMIEIENLDFSTDPLPLYPCEPE